MNKTLLYLFIFIGSAVGSYLPAVFGVSVFSPISILGGIAGGILGIWLAFKIGN